MNKELREGLKLIQNTRGIDPEEVLKVLEESLVSALRKSTPYERELTVQIDRATYDYHCTVKLTVVEDEDSVDDPSGEIPLAKALKKFPEAKVGDELLWEFDQAVFGRIAAQAARQVIMQRLHQAERRSKTERFAELMDQLVSGNVKRIDRDGIVVDFGDADGILRKEDKIPGENFEINDLVTGVLTEIDPDRSGPPLSISRSSTLFVQRLFEREVTEIASGIVKIRSIAREAGYRTKIAVSTEEPRIDPMGACVGVRGGRVRTIVREMAGEKVDIIEYSDDVSAYISNALKPARLKSITVDKDKKLVNVLVDEDQLSLAIGKKGQNVRLANRLTGWKIEVDKDVAPAPAANDYNSLRQRAIDTIAALEDVTEAEAEVLVDNGYASLDGLLAAEDCIDSIANLPGFNQDRAIAVIEAARAALKR